MTVPTRLKRNDQALDLNAELHDLVTLPVKTLQSRWLDAWGRPPPKSLSRQMLIRGLAHRMQEQQFGGLKPVTRRALARIGADRGKGRAVAG